MARYIQALRTGLIGSGKCAHAIVSGITKSGLAKPEKIITSDRDAAMLQSIKEMGVQTTDDNKETVKKSDVIILSVKPGVIPKVLHEVKDFVTKEKLVISIAAGVQIKDMEAILPPGTRLIRVMPNTPALVQTGATYIAPGSSIKDGDLDLVTSIFNSVGITEVGPECLVDVATGVSGSGPAYIFAAIEAMADGGVKMGFPRNVALKFAAQTCMGAAKMVLQTGKHPGELKDSVCSPGGTTIAAMHKLESGGYRGALIDAVEAATLRSIQLGKPKV